FDGGPGSNSLTLSGSRFSDETDTATGPASGSITLNDGFILSPDFTIVYANVSTLDDLSAPFSPGIGIGFPSHLTFNATGAVDAIDVLDGPSLAGLATTQITSGGTFATLNFANRNHVTVNTLGGDDFVELDNPNAAAGLADLTVNDSPNPGDHIQVNVDA